MDLTVISTPNAPGAIGPYSQGYICGSLVITSGQIPVDPASGDDPRRHRRPGGAELQERGRHPGSRRLRL